MTQRDWFQVLILAVVGLGVLFYLIRYRQQPKSDNDVTIDAPPAAPRRRRWRWGLLSEREMEIAQLAAEGLTNREIARKLHLSQSTVITHLHNIYTKLEIHNRIELAKALKEQIDP